MHSTTTVLTQNIVSLPKDLGLQAGDLGDLLLTIFDAGVGYGMGLPMESPSSPTIDALIETIKARWHGELRASRAERELYDAPLLADELPGWLLSLPNQKEVGHGGT